MVPGLPRAWLLLEGRLPFLLLTRTVGSWGAAQPRAPVFYTTGPPVVGGPGRSQRGSYEG